MSRSNKTDHAENPATRFFNWSGGTGDVVYYDRERKENVSVDLPFRFLVLDEVATVGGGYDNGDSFVGYWSNAIRPRDAKVSPFTVRSSVNGKSRTEAVGLWSEIKNSVTGAKYVKGLYIAFYDEDGALQLGFLKMKGAALMPWVEFAKQHKDIYSGAFAITGKVAKKKGTNNYFEPEFSYSAKVKDETNDAALALDANVLQPYLTAYFAQGQHTESHAEPQYTGGATEEPESVKAAFAGSPIAYSHYEDEPPF